MGLHGRSKPKGHQVVLELGGRRRGRARGGLCCLKLRGHSVVLELSGCWFVLELRGHLHMVFGKKKPFPFSYKRMKIFFHDI